MTFQWSHLLKVAERLISDNPPQEQQVRSAVNRAYYAALGEAREFALIKGLIMKSGPGSHQQIWNFLRHQAAPTQYESAAWKSIGDLGLALTSDRKLADYIAPASISVDDAKRVIITAYEIVRKLRGLR
jgi:uncharacterized protein (UPF0332 family)